MFWTLLLAHFIADYPLQTDGLVRAKRYWYGLTLHASIHLAMMLLLSGLDSLIIWPALVALALVHFAIDSLKNAVWVRWPRHVVVPYVADQVLHVASIMLIAFWIESHYGVRRDQTWTLLAVAFLGATHVWYITERVITHSDGSYQQAVQAHRWSRMIVRGLALSAYLLGAGLLSRGGAAAGPALFAGLPSLPYRRWTYGRRMLALDLLGPLLIAVLASAAAS